ncbi:ABC transporter ATP-binding protein [Sphaerisporangium corydalis]|uniref:ABC transporter ATP-binding protein n=1 Tax=Sphaerisporangium corydalis TaxID=1441875 RepID=A0ABV9ECJ5_9ACTN|nr:ATP-binding cassette domain-containing protein [Sphaerisporangium corydalis]
MTAAGASPSERRREIARLLPYAGPGPLAAAVALNLVAGLLPAGFIVWTSVMLAEVAAPAAGRPADLAATATALGLAVGAYIAQQVIVPYQAALGEIIARRVDGRCARRLMRAALADAPMAVLEREDVLSGLGDARDGLGRLPPTPGEAVAGALTLIARYTQLAGAVVLIGIMLSPVAAVVAAATALVIRHGQRGSLGRLGALWRELAGPRRRVAYLRGTGTAPTAAKEFRTLGLIDWYERRHRQDSREYLGALWAGRRRILFWPFVGYTLVGLAGGAALLLWLGRSAALGGLGLLEISIVLQAALVAVRFGTFFPESDVQTQYGLNAYEALETFEEVARRGAGETPRGDLPAAGLPRHGIRFEGVRFGYGRGRTVLDGLDLELPAGSSTAIVGLNGAGKTTLVKLLARLYDPDQGRIAVDGLDLRGLDPRDWQRRLAVIFQDYVRYELSAGANIGLGAPDALTDREALLAAARRAGALEVVQALPGGLDTPLSRQYAGGRDLSGGQWQRVALARAFLAVERGASVLVLDEPTAQLDVRAEVEFFDRFLAITGGLTTVIISHRFSTVRRADRIAVIEHGRVVEQGDHASLLRSGGRYAGLFNLQARRFGPGSDGVR